MDKRKQRCVAVTENLVRIAFNIIEMKTAAQHFEHSIACHVATGSDMGNMGHGRKQFNFIMQAAEIYLDEQTRQYLLAPLASTGLPPHIFVTADKSTVNGVTNQATLLGAMVKGKRAAIPVKVSPIYTPYGASPNDESRPTVMDDENGDYCYTEDELEDQNTERLRITGAKADELANLIYKDVKSVYNLSEQHLASFWQGTTCDGQFQAKDFAGQLHKNLSHKGPFFQVVWDPPHLIDLAIQDVLDGSIGTSRSLIRRLIERTSVVHRIFQYGKMYSQGRVQAIADQSKMYVTSRTCATRFSTSQYHEFVKLISSLPTYIKSFRKYQYSEVKEFQIAGQDFIFDLCAVVDVMRPVVSLLVELQSFQVPIWKIHVWKDRVISCLENMKVINVNNINVEMKNLKEHSKDIDNFLFKGTKLVPGWLMAENQNGESDESGHLVITWTAREIADCVEDA